MNENQQLKIIKAFKISDSNYIIGYSEHYSEYQVKEFAENEDLNGIKDIEYKIEFFKEQFDRIK